MRYYIEHLPMTIPMGVQSENNAEAVELDVSDWLARDGSLSFSVWVTRPGETEAYQAANATLKDGILYWWPTSADTAIAGEGRVEILAVSANRRMLSGWTATSIRETTTETTTDAPVDQRPWLDQALLASDEAKAAARSAADSADQAEGVVKKEIATLTEDINRNTAPPIIPTATGEIVTVSDSAHRPLAGLRLYGKTTQNGTPTPNSPVPLVNVGAGGSIGVKAMGKNLLKNTNGTKGSNGLIFTYNPNDGTVTINGTATASAWYAINDDIGLPAGKYIVNGNIGGGGNTYFLYAIVKRDGKDTNYSVFNGEDVAFSVADGDTTAAYFVAFADVTFNNHKMYPMIRPASITDATYEPYKVQTITASTTNGLPGIPVTSGGNYVDEHGQQWVCDEVDFGRGVYVQRVKKITLNGTETWSRSSRANTFLCANITDAFDVSGAAAHSTMALSNKYVGTGWETITTHDYAIALPWGVGLSIRNKDYDTAETFKAYLASNNCEAVYVLKNPIETPLSASELAAYRAMTSQKPTTTVYNDAGAGLGVDYIADTRNYIDQRISALLNA